MSTCDRKPPSQKAFITAVGQQLTAKHGKRQHYEPSTVADAVLSAGFPLDFACWAYCIFLTPNDFDSLHAAAGETCDYAAMHAEVLADLAGGTSSSIFDLSNFDLHSVDVGGIFDLFDFTP
jgi:hypothetical protein